MSIRDSDWIKVWSAVGTGNPEAYVDIDRWVDPLHTDAAYEYYVRYEFQTADTPGSVGIDEIYLETDLEMANTSLPALSLGANQIVYQDDLPGPHSVRVTHGWEESEDGESPRPPEGALFPEDGAQVPLAELASLRWGAAGGRGASDGDAIADYHVQVSARADMLIPVSPNLDRITFSPEPEWAVPEGWLVPGETYHWRVRARNEHGLWSNWSHIWSFRTS